MDHPAADDHVDLATRSTPALFTLYRAILAELRSRGIVRTENAPAGDYAEYLVATAFGGHLQANSKQSWDVLVDDKRLQVKARVVSVPPRPGQRQLSVFRSFDFDAAIIVLLADTDYGVWRAVEVPVEVVKAHATLTTHVNGHVLFATDDILNDVLATDVTDRLRHVGFAST